MTDIIERQILTAYRQQALNRLRYAHVALWDTLPRQDGDNKIDVWLNTEYGMAESNSKEFLEFMRAAMSIASAEDAANAKIRADAENAQIRAAADDTDFCD